MPASTGRIHDDRKDFYEQPVKIHKRMKTKASPPINPVYFFYGPEDYLIE
jgi:hypothetical protein